MPLYLAIGLAVAVAASGCGKKSSANTDDQGYKEISTTFDNSEPPPEERKPIEGVDVSGLSKSEQSRFDRLVDKLPSPCGKAHSLRTSKNTDTECTRASFAIRYLVELLKDGFTNDEVQELYDAKYKQAGARRGFKLSANNPHSGPDDAKVVLVEFFDYGCPACEKFRPVLEATMKLVPSDAVLYYKMYPLAAHPDSKGAAQAAIAAHKQGKFHEMHDALFADQLKHKKEDLDALAKSIGLDMTRFEADYQAAEAFVAADHKEGDDAGVEGTPTLFISGRLWQGIADPKYLKMWIDEELAVGAQAAAPAEPTPPAAAATAPK